MSLLSLLFPLCLLALGWSLRRGGSRSGILADLLALAALLLLVWPVPEAAPRPSGGERPTLALVVDVSSSMAATDGAPTRLEQAKRELRTLIDGLPGARFALIPFAGEAVLQVPPTDDRTALRFFIDRLGPDLVAAPGSAPEEALQRAAAALADNGEQRAVVLFSDGERTVERPPPPTVRTLPVYVVPCGSKDGVPLTDTNGRPRRDAEGRTIVSRCDRTRLAALVAGEGTMLEGAGTRPAVLPLLQRWQVTTPSESTTFPWRPVMILILLLLRHLPRLQSPWRRHAVASALFCSLLACRGATPTPGEELFHQAVQMADSGDPLQQEEAIELFTAAARNLDGAERGAALFNRGTLLLAAGQPEPALAALEQALLLRPGDEQVIRNFTLALRVLGPQRTPGVGEGGDGRRDENGSGLDRNQVLQLLEAVRPDAAAPNVTDRTVREQAVARDW